jgi:hypothetical protein
MSETPKDDRLKTAREKRWPIRQEKVLALIKAKTRWLNSMMSPDEEEGKAASRAYAAAMRDANPREQEEARRSEGGGNPFQRLFES